jgi:hypothetical protein
MDHREPSEVLCLDIATPLVRFVDNLGPFQQRTDMRFTDETIDARQFGSV